MRKRKVKRIWVFYSCIFTDSLAYDEDTHSLNRCPITSSAWRHPLSSAI